MNDCIITLLFREHEFDFQFVLKAIAHTERVFPLPHPHPGEIYTLTTTGGLSAICYEIADIDERSHLRAIELFGEDQFPLLVQRYALERQTFCFYLYIDSAAEGLSIVCRYDEKGFEELQRVDKKITRIFMDEHKNVKTETTDHDVLPSLTYDPVIQFLKEQTGLSQQTIAGIWHGRHIGGRILAQFNCE